ncbi:MAG: glutathione S-transferase family protein [Rhodobiaceae bacterium]
MKLFGAPLSPFVRKAVIVAAEKVIEYEYDPRPSPLGWTEGFEEINPLKRIPALLPDPSNPDYAINDSSAICAYFEKLQPEPSLYPQEAEAHGRALWIEEAADTDLANRVGMGVFRPVFFSLAAGKPADTETASKGFEALAEVLLPYLENQLGDGDWFAGDMFSIADIAVMTQLMNLDLVGFGLPQERFPNLRAHYERCIARPSIAPCIEQNNAFIEKAGFQIERVTG